MRRDSKLSGVLHVVLHMADRTEPTTSEKLSELMMTNPVVVRRIMAGLRDAGLVHSAKGHGGGWTLACDPAQTTLYQVFQAVGSPEVLALGHRTESPDCLVEQAVNAALSEALDAAEALLMSRLRQVTLADLTRDFKHRMKHKQHGPKGRHTSCKKTRL